MYAEVVETFVMGNYVAHYPDEAPRLPTREESHVVLFL